MRARAAPAHGQRAWHWTGPSSAHRSVAAVAFGQHGAFYRALPATKRGSELRTCQTRCPQSSGARNWITMWDLLRSENGLAGGIANIEEVRRLAWCPWLRNLLTIRRPADGGLQAPVTRQSLEPLGHKDLWCRISSCDGFVIRIFRPTVATGTAG
jgi:hypothetical protein